MANRTVVNGLAGATTVASLLWLYWFLHPRPPGIDRRPHEALGEVLAGETVKLLSPGDRLIVIARDPALYEVPAARAQFDGFQRAIQAAGAKITATRLLKPDPLRVVTVPPGEFSDLMRQCQTNDVIVSFLGPPVLGPEQLAKLGDKRPRVLAVCSGGMPAQVDLKKIFQQNLLLAAVISRPEAPARASSGSASDAFEQMFKLITRANVAELPSSAMARN